MKLNREICVSNQQISDTSHIQSFLASVTYAIEIPVACVICIIDHKNKVITLMFHPVLENSSYWLSSGHEKNQRCAVIPEQLSCTSIALDSN
jgi:hypothetical protein